MPGTKLNFSIGSSFLTAQGETLLDSSFLDKILKVAFPNRIYMLIEHPREENLATGRFSFEFWYLDQDVSDENGEKVEGGASY